MCNVRARVSNFAIAVLGCLSSQPAMRLFTICVAGVLFHSACVALLYVLLLFRGVHRALRIVCCVHNFDCNVCYTLCALSWHSLLACCGHGEIGLKRNIMHGAILSSRASALFTVRLCAARAGSARYAPFVICKLCACAL